MCHPDSLVGMKVPINPQISFPIIKSNLWNIEKKNLKV